MRVNVIRPEFVDFIPGTLQDGTLYVSRKYATAAHNCCCGCGTKIVTPLRPTDWTLTLTDGAASLHPSVGNWNHPCQSHYVIRNSRVVWAEQMSGRQIKHGRLLDQMAKDAYYGNSSDMPSRKPSSDESDSASAAKMPIAKRSLWSRLKHWLKNRILR